MVRPRRQFEDGAPNHILLTASDPSLFAPQSYGAAASVRSMREKHCREFLARLKANSEKYGMAVLSYCLMPTHVHLLALQEHGGDMAKAIGATASQYAKDLNNYRLIPNKTWRRRYKSRNLDEQRARLAMIFIEQNPCRSLGGFELRRPHEYKWSSAKANCAGKCELGLLQTHLVRNLIGSRAWKRQLSEELTSVDLERISVHRKRGRPPKNITGEC